MTNWEQLQRDFQNYLHFGDLDIEQAIVNTPLASAKTRLQIYRDAYQARLEEAMASNFPHLRTCLGNEVFHQMSLDYLASYPSTYRSIRWYGDKLASFLASYYREPFIAELAQFEWNMTLAFDAAESPVFQLDQMAAIPTELWESMILKAHPSLNRMNFLWNVVDLWEALANGQELPTMNKSLKPSPWVLWRHEYMNRFYLLADDEAWALDNTLKGLSFGEFCEGLFQWHDEDAIGMRAASLLKNWIQSGFITDISFQ